MVTVVISPVNVVKFLDGGGHFWVYMQYVQGLHQLGCEVYWLERFPSSGDQVRDARVLSTFAQRMERYGLAGKLLLYTSQQQNADSGQPTYLGMTQCEAEAIMRRADLLLNFDYSIDPVLLSCFRRTAVVDIDPGLLQFWMATRQLLVPPHDVYFTTGETVGTPAALFPDGGRPWVQIRPPVCLERWPYVHDPRCDAFTTVSSWWSGDWFAYGTERYDNNKRVAFLEFIELPRRTSQRLELALWFGDKKSPERLFGKGDAQDLCLLEEHGWRVRHSRQVASTPESYQAYIQSSRGEFSCAKPSYIKLQTAWISDRTLCYLASGKPVVVQHTGPSSFLPNGEGLFRFATMEEAVEALATINRDYERHCRAARALAEAYFDARQVLRAILNVAL
jgi:hypothetical protein